MRDAAYRASVGAGAREGGVPAVRRREAASPPAWRGGCPRTSAPRSARTACATATCCRSRRPARSASPSPTTPRTASSRPIPGPTPAGSASPTGRCASTAVEDHAWRLWRARGGNADALPPAFVNALEIAARDHMKMQAAIQPYIDAAISKTVNVPEDYPFEDFEIALPRGLARRAEGHHHLPAEQRARRGALGGRGRGAAGPRPVRARPAHPHRRRAAGGAGGAALAAPAEADRRLAVLDLHGRGAGQPLRGLRRPRRERRAAAVRGLGERRADAARAGGARQEPLDGHARAGPRLAEAEARQPGEDPGRAVHRARCRRTGGRCRSPATVSAFAKVVQYRCEALGVFDGPEGETPLVDAMFSRKEPKSGRRRHAQLDRRHPEPDDRRRLRDVRQGMRAARRHASGRSAYGCQGPIRSSSTA